MKVASSAADSNTGRKRRHNEDAYVSAPPMFAVADGMGGAQAGEVASALAAATLIEGQADQSAGGEGRVVELIRAANRRVHQRAIHDASVSGMGTTMTAAVVQPDGTVAIGHVGDSRAYRLRDGNLEQLTEDHSLVAELVRRGELTPEEAAVHPQRSVITRALGTDADVDVDSFTVEAQAGDVFLLCSDGLTTMVDGDTIAAIVQRHHRDLKKATRALIKAANDSGGEDNITAVLFALGEGEAETPPAPAAGRDPDDEDTLHPEDGVRLPATDVPAADITMVVPAGRLDTALSPAAAGEPAPGDDPAEQASLARLILASLLAVGLVALIVVLIFVALPR